MVCSLQAIFYSPATTEIQSSSALAREFPMLWMSWLSRTNSFAFALHLTYLIAASYAICGPRKVFDGKYVSTSRRLPGRSALLVDL